jgi:hypothetical protein
MSNADEDAADDDGAEDDRGIGPQNGAGAGDPDAALSLTSDAEAADSRWLHAPPPEAIHDLAHACVGFVERAVGVKLDFLPETLPLLDHYLAGARAVLRHRPGGGAAGSGVGPESMELIAQTAGAYLGEVIRRRYASWWRLDSAVSRPAVEGASLDEHRLEFHRLQLVVHPVSLVLEALTVDAGRSASLSGFDLDPEDAEAAMRRLEDLPPVEVEEFVSPSTRLEVLDIVVDAVRVKHAAAGYPALELEPGDYVH